MTLEEIRSQFPFLKTGVIYLNHAATSPWSSYVECMVNKFRDVRTYGEIEIFPEIIQTIADTRALAAEMLGTDSSRIAFVQNTSEGLNILANGLEWKSGDRILIPEIEFPANVYPFLNLKRHSVEIDFVRQTNGIISLEEIERSITPRTKLLSISWVQFLSGFKIDLNALYELCASKGVLLSVDAIQGLGALRLNVSKTPIDFLSAGVQKWQMGLQGSGIVYLSEEMQQRINQSNVGWLSVKDAWNFFDYQLEFLDGANRYENGTYNTIGIYGYLGALTLFKAVGFDEVEHRVRKNADLLYSLAQDRNFELLTPVDSYERAGIVTLKHPSAEQACIALRERRIIVSPRSGYIRISPHFYNTTEEIEEAVDAIAETM